MYLVTNDADIIAGYPKAILTPNGGEFPAIYEKMVLHCFTNLKSIMYSLSQLGEKIQDPSSNCAQEETKALATKLGGVTVVRKGHTDIISNGTKGAEKHLRKGNPYQFSHTTNTLGQS